MSDPVLQPPERFFATPEEYLDHEVDAEEKHEWIDGEVRPLHRGDALGMAGGRYDHALISANAVRHLGNRIAGQGCRALTSDLRVRTPIFRRERGSRGLYTYPDCTVVCGKPDLDHAGDGARETLRNPTLLVEVLSPSTESNDRGEKFARYGTIETFREYVLVAQDRPLVEVFLRQGEAGDSWKITRYDDLDAVARLDSLDVDLPLADLYDGVTFP